MSLGDSLAIWGLVIGAVGLVVTVVGFILAIIQLKKTATAATATKDAILVANSRMLYNHLLVVLPQLTSMEADIDRAMLKDDKDGAVRALVSFSHAAMQVAALLDSHDPGNNSELVEQLRTTAREASHQKGVIVSGSKKTVSLLLNQVSIDIANVAGRCVGLASTYQTKVG